MTARQQAFLCLPHEEAFFGGAAGGGKSDALLAAALQWVDVPDYAAIIFRRTYSDLSLPGALMDRSRDWLSHTDALWKDKEKTWEFPSGATLTFGYLQTEKDKFRYKSAEFQYIGFDELTQFTRTQYLFLFSRRRRLARAAHIPLRVRSASNPGDIGHEWVKQRFVNPGHPMRPFIPSRLEDNPHLDQVAYERSLLELDPITRAQMRYGDWDVMPQGGKFQRGWFEVTEIEPVNLRKVRYWDLAATLPKDSNKDPDWTAGALVGIDPEGRWHILNVRRVRASPGDVERLIRRTADEDGLETTIVMEQEPGSAGISLIDQYRRKVIPGFAFHGMPSTGKKEVRANVVSAHAEAGNVLVKRGAWNDGLFDELEIFPYGAHDDQVDAVSGAFTWLARKGGWAAF